MGQSRLFERVHFGGANPRQCSQSVDCVTVLQVGGAEGWVGEGEERTVGVSPLPSLGQRCPQRFNIVRHISVLILLLYNLGTHTHTNTVSLTQMDMSYPHS